MKINDLRNEIDNIDDKILELLNQRAEYARQIALIKQEKNSAVEVPEREKAILDRLKSGNKGFLDEEAIENIFKEIIIQMKNLQHKTITSIDK